MAYLKKCTTLSEAIEIRQADEFIVALIWDNQVFSYGVTKTPHEHSAQVSITQDGYRIDSETQLIRDTSLVVHMEQGDTSLPG